MREVRLMLLKDRLWPTAAELICRRPSFACASAMRINTRPLSTPSQSL